MHSTIKRVGKSRVLTSQQCQKKDIARTSFFGAEDEIIRFAHSVAPPTTFVYKPTHVCGRCSHVRSLRRNSEPASVTRGQFTSSHESVTPKKRTSRGRPFLAQKTRFELVLRFSHTTPLAGEPLEPLGYFCMAHIQKL